MAKCEKREIKVEPPPAEYVLTLTGEEARQIKHILAGFHRDDKLTRAVWVAMTNAGVNGDRVPFQYDVVRRV